MREYFVPQRPGIAASSEKRRAESNIETLNRIIGYKREEIERDGRDAYNFELAAIERDEEKIRGLNNIIAECDAIIASAHPDEHYLQKQDDFLAAQRNFEEDKRSYLGFLAHRIEVLMETGEIAEASRIASLYSEIFSNILFLRVQQGIKLEEYIIAIEEYRDSHMLKPDGSAKFSHQYPEGTANVF